jgi:hypothetical protein
MWPPACQSFLPKIIPGGLGSAQPPIVKTNVGNWSDEEKGRIVAEAIAPGAN